MEIADIVRKECIGVFAGDRARQAGFGVANKAEAAMLLQLCAPDVHYSKRSIIYHFLPRSFKGIISDPERFNESFGIDTLYAFHHYFDARRAAKRLREYAANERHLLEQVGEGRFRRMLGRPPLDAASYLRQLRGRYANPTCIRMNLWGYASLLGEYEVTDRVTSHMKQGAEQTFELLGQLVPEHVVEQERRQKRMVAVYDFFRRPVENWSSVKRGRLTKS